MGEQNNVHEWLNRKPKSPPPEAELRKVAEVAEGWKVPGAKKAKAEAWEALEAMMDESGGGSSRLLWRPYMAVAAVVVLLIASVVIFRGDIFGTTEPGGQLLVVNTPAGTTNSVALPDASQVEVNASSTLQYNAQTWSEDRTVALAGEAFFAVAKGETFTVTTDLGSVEVLGTKFNVYARGGDFRVTCEEGTVRVSTPTGESTTLTAGEATRLQGQRLVTDNELAPQQTLAWRQGVFHFDAAPLPEVFEEVERQFGVTVVMELQEDHHFTGSFKRDNLEAAVASITLPMLLHYEIVAGDTVRITE